MNRSQAANLKARVLDNAMFSNQQPTIGSGAGDQDQWASVKTEEDVIQYFKSVYPYLGEETHKAMGRRLTEIKETYQTASLQEKKELYERYTKARGSADRWDWKADLKQQEMEAKEKLASENAQKLLAELDLQEEIKVKRKRK